MANQDRKQTSAHPSSSLKSWVLLIASLPLSLLSGSSLFVVLSVPTSIPQPCCQFKWIVCQNSVHANIRCVLPVLRCVATHCCSCNECILPGSINGFHLFFGRQVTEVEVISIRCSKGFLELVSIVGNCSSVGLLRNTSDLISYLGLRDRLPMNSRWPNTLCFSARRTTSCPTPSALRSTAIKTSCC